METKLDDSASGSGNLVVVEKLLQELRPNCRDKHRYQILENYYLLATKQKANVDKAMKVILHYI